MEYAMGRLKRSSSWRVGTKINRDAIERGGTGFMTVVPGFLEHA